MATNTVDVLARMDEEEKRAAERPTGTFVPTFLRLKGDQKARIRPLFNLQECVVLAMHNEYNAASPKDSINAVCSSEVGGDCPYCEAAKTNKKLSAGTSFFLPIYVSQVAQKGVGTILNPLDRLTEAVTGKIEQKGVGTIWTPLTYKDKEDKEHEVSGLRLLELKMFGSIYQVFKFIRDLYREDDNHDIRQYGLIIERSDINPKNPTYTTLPKGPGPMPEVAKALIPTADVVRGMVLAACPPAGTSVVSSAPVAAGPSAKEKKEDFDF